ncbi:DUF3019 domain-containing protein [Shewanella surugensis]|uniref:DUF3019 domain-containing protein n=1 Tax=Shewanella surugensis TaxID=212020 RepID=A0ABT0LGM4_9GAMM|nr:DUF3019 domain-containing protein [Shewanella surugensis]MCL1126851.1 DUF3019 domain-containing protein [Shewanella surugensis]
MGGEAVAHENKNQAILQLFPEFCITSSKQLSCDLKVELKWELNLFKPICILSNYHELMKWCNDSPRIKSLTLNINTEKDIRFIMIDKETNKTLAGAELKVTPALMPNLRRNFRNAWSLF